MSINFVRPFLLILGLLCLCVAAIALINGFSELDVSLILNNNLLVAGILIQIVASLLFVLAWKKLLALQGGLKLGIFETTSHIGTTLLGKYIPGKIWGLVGRSYLLKTHRVGIEDSANLLLLDQVLTFSSGIVITIFFLSIFYLKIWAVVLLLPLVYGLALLLKTYSVLTSTLFRIIKRALRQQGNDTNELTVNEVNPHAFYQVFLIYILHWIITALALAIVVYPFISQDFVNNALLITAAIPTAMLAGFIALWAPGGIGVREVVIVIILSLQMSIETATLIAVVYRIICIVIDMVIGTISLGYFSGNSSIKQS